MNNTLQQSTSLLYATFAVYLLNNNMDGCPCCVSGEDKLALHSKTLHLLTEDDFGRYPYKAMTTWGDVNDFKHFLPRLLELLANEPSLLDVYTISNKLNYAHWADWPAPETNAVKDFLLAWWRHKLLQQESFDIELLMDIYPFLGDVNSLLADWQPAATSKGFWDFLSLAESFPAIASGTVGYERLDHSARTALAEWIISKKHILEDAFFQFDGMQAERISNALYWIEQGATTFRIVAH